MMRCGRYLHSRSAGKNLAAFLSLRPFGPPTELWYDCRRQSWRFQIRCGSHHPRQREAGVSASPYAGEPLIRGRLEGFLTLSLSLPEESGRDNLKKEGRLPKIRRWKAHWYNGHMPPRPSGSHGSAGCSRRKSGEAHGRSPRWRRERWWDGRRRRPA